MKRLTIAALRAAIVAAAVLVVPFSDGTYFGGVVHHQPFLVPAERAEEVPYGILTISHEALFLIEVRLWWELRVGI